MSLRRLTALCCALAALAAIILARVYWVGSDTAYAASAGRQTTQTTELPRARGNFFDRTGRPLTGTETTRYALCIPGDNSYSALLPCVPYQAQTLLYERRNTTSPFLIEIGQTAAPAGTLLLDEPRRTLPSPIAVHLLGYLDQENHGVTGLERAWDTVLAESCDQTAAVCQTTARGRLLGTATPEIITEQQGTGAQVKLTLDADIQRLCEGIAQLTMPRGCILVMDTATGEILASVSMPEYDPGDVARSIRADDTSLVNRAFATFSVGSVFKVAAALAAYENGMDWFTHDCTGSIEVDGQTYRCALGKAHGTVNLRGALEQSCNTYFVALGQRLGGMALRAAASELGFGTAVPIAPDLTAGAGVLPTAKELQSTGQLSVFSFGQGSFTATPLQITAMMNTIAAGGTYRTPRFCCGVTDADGTVTEKFQLPAPRTVCDAATAKVLRSMLQSVVEDGIGYAAKPIGGTAAGKTGTAQTGQFDAAGDELLNYWFSGFIPAGDPQYTITVLQDGVLEPEISSAAIFAQIAAGLQVIEQPAPD